VIGVRYKKADEEERNDVEHGYAPEYLLNSRWQGLARVSSLRRSQSHQLSTAVSESGRHEGRAHAFEPVMECSWVNPVPAPDIRPSLASSAVKYYAKNASLD